MSDDHTIYWEGASGRQYMYLSYRIGQAFVAKPGNYIFAKEAQPHAYTAVYIGQTGDLSERFDDHHKMPCIRAHGATHIHVHRSSKREEERLAEETDLLRKWNTPCNE